MASLAGPFGPALDCHRVVCGTACPEGIEKMSGTLVHTTPFGRLGNRLFLHAHLAAYCHKVGAELVDLPMDSHRSAFPALPNYTRWSKFAWRTLDWWPGTSRFHCWGDEDRDFDQKPVPELEVPLARGRSVSFSGWRFRGYASLKRFRHEVTEELSWSQPIAEVASAKREQARALGDLVIGVHIRWEDYRGTSRFIDLEGFHQRMGLVIRALAPQHVCFMVFCNESLPDDPFPGLPVVLARGSVYEDLAAMERCDLLMGPPSTFSAWASFAGQVPLWALDSAGSKVPEWVVCRG